MLHQASLFYLSKGRELRKKTLLYKNMIFLPIPLPPILRKGEPLLRTERLELEISGVSWHRENTKGVRVS